METVPQTQHTAIVDVAMVLQDENTFYLVSLAVVDETLSRLDDPTPLTITSEELLTVLAVYGLTRYVQDVRLMQVYTTTGDLRGQEIVLYVPCPYKAERVMQQLVLTVLKEAEALPAFKTLSPIEQLVSAICDRHQLSFYTCVGMEDRCRIVAEKCYSIFRGALQQIAIYAGEEAYSQFTDTFDEISHVEVHTL